MHAFAYSRHIHGCYSARQTTRTSSSVISQSPATSRTIQTASPTRSPDPTASTTTEGGPLTPIACWSNGRIVRRPLNDSAQKADAH